MRLADLRNIDINDIPSWPVPVKVFGAVVIGIVILFLGYWFWIQDDRGRLERAERQELQLRETFKAKKALAINLPAYKKQMQQMEKTFGQMLRQLPNKAEIPDLLIDITQAGLGRGLQFELFKPGAKRYADFYATLPIDVRVLGTYHEIGLFVSDLAALPRIVSLGDFQITRRGQGNKLVMATTALTYHYLEQEEIEARAAQKGKKPRRRRR